MKKKIAVFELVLNLFRVPSNGDLKSQWLDRISQHQKIGPLTSFMVCERHFIETDFKMKRGKRALVNGAIPSIFDQEPHLSQPDHDQNVTKYAMTEK